jgi:hypothetical protein
LDMLMVMLLFAWRCHILFHQLISPSSKLLLWLLHVRYRHCSISLICRTLPIQRVLYKSKNTIVNDRRISIKKERKREMVPTKDAWSMCLLRNQSCCIAFLVIIILFLSFIQV